MQDQTRLEPETSASSVAIASSIFNHAIISLTHQDIKLVECCLTCQLPLEIYQTIEKNSLLNLKPELCNQSVTFSPNSEITLKATLHPDRLPDISENTTPETALQYLQQLSETQPEHPLLNLDNWFALSAYQGEVGYTTLWTTLNPSKMAAGTINEEELTQSLSQFLTNLTETELTKASDNFFQEIFSDFTNLFQVGDRNPIDEHPITNAMIAFFTNDDWTFTKIQGKPILQMGYQGKNGQWLCYARANESPQQFAFYSICPTIAPQEQRLAIAEFITHANNGIVIGNFELNFSSGEIMYKTSIDVEGDRITSTLIKRLVYANVVTIDQYLPGIMAVIAGKLSPTDAIALVENNSDEESEKGDE
ncbi:YbjN domain-containing protein [Calothrix membranacea FACHB-236]|nr:YbjN domain-containing protein [Calothrix membranacea FACHB-236]